MEIQQNITPQANNSGLNGITITSTQVTYICGKRGTGKSYLADYILPRFQRFALYDFATMQHGKLGDIITTPEDLDEYLTRGGTKAIIQPRADLLKKDCDKYDLFDKFCTIILKHGNIMFAIEETGEVTNGYTNPPVFDTIVRTGRNYGIGLLCMNLRPKRISTNLIALIDHWFVFASDYPDDIDFITNYLGRTRALSLKTLPKRMFYYKNEDGVKLCNPI